MADPILANSVPSGSPISPAVIRRVLTHQAERHWIFRRFVGTGEFSQIQLQEEQAVGGDTVRLLFSPTREQGGFTSTDTIEGSESQIDFQYDEMKINAHKFAWSLDDVMSQQRAPVSLRRATLTKAPIQWQRHWERNFVYQLTGFTPVNTAAGLTNVRAVLPQLAADAHVRNFNLGGMNEIAAVDANHRVYTTGSAVATVGGSTEAIAGMKLKFIDDLLLRATAGTDYPLMPGPDGMYDLVVHPNAILQIKRDTTDLGWSDITRARLEGGEKPENNGIFSNYIGTYAGVRIWTSYYLPPAPDAAGTSYEAGTRCAVFLGAKAACLTFGAGFGSGSHLDYREQMRDYDVWGTRVASIYGFKRVTFPNLSGTSETYGSLLLIHYDGAVS